VGLKGGQAAWSLIRCAVAPCPAGCRYLGDAVIDIRRAELVVDAVPQSELSEPGR
jgi:hypothetical protein